MEKTSEAITGNLEVVQATGYNRADRREKEKYKRTVKGFRHTVELMDNHVKGIKNHLLYIIEEGEADAGELEPAFEALDKRIDSYKTALNWDGIRGAVPPKKLRGPKIAELIKDFDVFMYEIEQAKEADEAAAAAAEEPVQGSGCTS